MTITEGRSKNRRLLRKANAAGARGDNETAEKYYQRYIACVPDDPQALFNLGVLRQHAVKSEKDPVRLHQLCVEAVGYYARAIESPELDLETKANALNNHGLIMGRLGFPEKAKIAFHYALQLHPGHRAARLNFADILVFDGDYQEADRQFAEIVNSDPTSAGARFSRGMLLMLLGDIRSGFREYRARFNVPSFPSKTMATDKPMWGGEALDGKVLFITQEQGWGDAIQFIRYAGVLKSRWPGCRIVFVCADSMHRLLRGAVGLDGCVTDPPPADLAFDYHVPLLHLPDICGTTLETIPASAPYILPQPDWLDLPLEPTEKRRVGIVWAGSPIHGKDKWRSMKPEQFQRFIDAAPGSQFYSLQCGPRAHETEQLTNCVNLPLLIHDWTETANAILQMDMVITVDTAIAHLAGALGVPAWILLPYSPDFRWMLGRSDSPWYPRARLFRQPAKDDWGPVIEAVCAELSLTADTRPK